MFKGSMVALVTPMTSLGDIDYKSLDKLVEFHIEQGTDAIVAVGTTGESATLDVKEHCLVIKHIVDRVSGRLPVIAGTGANSTSEAIELTRSAKSVGANACLLVTPYYNKPNQDGLFLHYQAIANAVDIPQILYNVPGRTACDMLPETIGRLAKIDNIIGVKEATGELDRVQQIKQLCDDNFDLYSGDDATTREFILLGGHGSISVTANVAPAKMHAMCTAALNGDADLALDIDRQLQPLHQTLFLQSNPMPVKWAVAKMGLMGQTLRLPLTPLADEYHQPLLEAMKFAEVTL